MSCLNTEARPLNRGLVHRLSIPTLDHDRVCEEVVQEDVIVLGEAVYF